MFDLQDPYYTPISSLAYIMDVWGTFIAVSQPKPNF